MESTEQNGHNNPRMDRVERMMQMRIADHLKLADEHNKLLTAQILLTDRMDKLTGSFDKLTGTMRELAESQTATDGRMTVLITMMDNFIRERGEARRAGDCFRKQPAP